MITKLLLFYSRVVQTFVLCTKVWRRSAYTQVVHFGEVSTVDVVVDANLKELSIGVDIAHPVSRAELSADFPAHWIAGTFIPALLHAVTLVEAAKHRRDPKVDHEVVLRTMTLNDTSVQSLLTHVRELAQEDLHPWWDQP